MKHGISVSESFPLRHEEPIFRHFIRDVGTKFQSSESLSHLIASVLILQEPKTAKNRKLSWENDEAQTQKLNQGRIIKKIGFFSSKFQPEQKCFLDLVKNR
jgi:hypothetical protein